MRTYETHICPSCGTRIGVDLATCGECEMAASIVAANEAAQPQWTTEPPTEPGWYWVRQGHNQPIVAWVRELDRKMRVKLFGNAYHNDVDEKMFTHWMKIEAPEPPK